MRLSASAVPGPFVVARRVLYQLPVTNSDRAGTCRGRTEIDMKLNRGMLWATVATAAMLVVGG